MFGDYVFEKTAAQYTKKMMLVDADHLEEKAHYSAVFQAHGFRIVAYTDDLNFRVNDTSLLNGEKKLAILVQPGVYVPCDIRKKCREPSTSGRPFWYLRRLLFMQKRKQFRSGRQKA